LKQLKLKSIRTLHEISQQELADALSISLNSFRNKEAGVTEFKFTECAKIKDFIDTKHNADYEFSDIFTV